jgi:hypothetical protein
VKGRWRVVAGTLFAGIAIVAALGALLGRSAVRAHQAAGQGADGARPVDASGAGHGGRWTQRALALQYELAGDVGLANAPWVATHNSFNSVAEMGSGLGSLDANQTLPLRAQLGLGVRSLELDLHWLTPATGGPASGAVVVCHGRGGSRPCAGGRPLAPTLAELAGWLRRPANRDQVLLLYMQNALGSSEEYASAAATIAERLGGLVNRPADGTCTPLPLDLTRGQVLAAGAQVVIFANGCGSEPAWQGEVFDGSEREERPVTSFSDFPACGRQLTRGTFDGTLVRYFDTSTPLDAAAAAVGVRVPDRGITPHTAAEMARCGVDVVALNDVRAGDPRLRRLVWSWAPGEPHGGRCAVQAMSASFPHGRWHSAPCSQRHPVACRTSAGRWLVSRDRGSARSGGTRCRKLGAAYAVPRTGYESQLLRLAMRAGGAQAVWLGYRRSASGWRALDRR